MLRLIMKPRRTPLDGNVGGGGVKIGQALAGFGRVEDAKIFDRYSLQIGAGAASGARGDDFACPGATA